MAGQSKNQCLLNKRTESQSFFILWSYFIKLSKVLEKIDINSETGQFLLKQFKSIGRQKVKRRGKLLLMKEDSAKNFADLFVNRGNSVVNIPFYLVVLLKEALKEKDLSDLECMKEIGYYVKKIVEIAYKVAQENGLIIDIVYRKLLARYRNIYILKSDLLMEGFLGLIHAVYSFSPERKVKFETYAYNWCWKYMFAYAKAYLFNSGRLCEYNDKLLIGKRRKERKIYFLI